MSTVGVVLVGAAHIHVGDLVRIVRSRPGVEVITVWDHDAARAERWAGAFGARPVVDFEAALTDPVVRGALVYSETSHHPALVSAVAAQTLPVFVEKPLAVRPSEAMGIAEVLAGNPLFSTGFFLRYASPFAALRERVLRGDAGSVLQADIRVAHGGLALGWFDGEHAWMREPSEGGGGFFDLVLHGLDLVRWVLGAIEEVVEVQVAASGHHGTAVLRAAGARVDVEAGWEATDTAFEMTVTGTDATLTATGGTLVANPRPTVVASGPPPDAGDAPAAWLDTLCGGPDRPMVGLTDAVEAVRVTASLRRAAAAG